MNETNKSCEAYVAQTVNTNFENAWDICYAIAHNTERMRSELLRMSQSADKAVKLQRALKVLTLDPTIRAFLEANDPKALTQAEAALE